MAVCPKCGSPVTEGTKYCGACGASVEPAPNAPPPLSQPARDGLAPTGGQGGGMAANSAAMLTYVPLCLVGLVCAVLFGFVLEPYKRDRFIRFHAWQSLAVHGVVAGFWVGWFVFSAVVAFIARFLAFMLAAVAFPISMLVGLGTLVLMVFLMIKAYGNESFKLPIIGDWAEKQANR